MSHNQHDLAHEFADYMDRIRERKQVDNHFKRLCDEYESVSAELHGVSDGAGCVGDARAEDLKKKRLELKDEIFARIKDMDSGSTCAC